MRGILAEYARQFPLVAGVVAVGWYFHRHIVRQHAREIAAKDGEIRRILEERDREIRRIVRERKQYVDLALKVRARVRKMKPPPATGAGGTNPDG